MSGSSGSGDPMLWELQGERVNFWHSGTLALSRERQSAQMSEIECVGQTWMALSTSKCNHLTPLHFKGYGYVQSLSIRQISEFGDKKKQLFITFEMLE